MTEEKKENKKTKMVKSKKLPTKPVETVHPSGPTNEEFAQAIKDDLEAAKGRSLQLLPSKPAEELSTEEKLRIAAELRETELNDAHESKVEKEAKELIDRPGCEILHNMRGQAVPTEAPRNVDDDENPYRPLTKEELEAYQTHDPDDRSRAHLVASRLSKTHQRGRLTEFRDNPPSRALEEQRMILQACENEFGFPSSPSIAGNIPQENIDKAKRLMQRLGYSVPNQAPAVQPTKEALHMKEEKKQISVGLARRIWQHSGRNAIGYASVEVILNNMFPDKAYMRPYQYGAVSEQELNLGCLDTIEYEAFHKVLNFHGDWISKYYGPDAPREERNARFSIHRVYLKDTNTYDFVTVEDSYSTRPLCFPTKDMADSFKEIFHDLLEIAGRLV